MFKLANLNDLINNANHNLDKKSAIKRISRLKLCVAIKITIRY